ncbi:hypothetical protein ZYGR_0N07120 [Zygosaccharomyces rouxii]|uniref:ZYRO0D16654p n=2 Tax=Zygosaccharomyces rouxii TaxID=4956 RepID=C5DWQ1_ZYGRC|nr:uncharacterized protein ZYRO0D16654g [Zygosaccharomyces rouxii]KAH9201130.1 cytochrome b5-like heme/steroid binding domain-containing protein [Zygosaccharomyces rouxii]GAV49305.1 hypothetical protein ZYGR_0N07120 [Zygosaccharomyces rouxii]CAR28220.1 ZYRO0D16654p [Zygosaccharomyces rouxii]
MGDYKEVTNNNNNKEKQVPLSVDDEDLPSLSWDEIRKHMTPPDCWMVIHGRVYNVAPVLASHPGGSQILLHYVGRDATYPFDDVGHSMESLIFDMPPGSLKGKLENCAESRVRGGYVRGSDGKNDDNEDKEEVVVTQSQAQSYMAIWNRIYTVLLYCVILVCAILLTCLRWRNGERQVLVNEDIPSWAFS